MSATVQATAVDYEGLTPLPRVRLIYAAGKRGDTAEQERLAKSAPRVTWDIPDFQGLSEALSELPLFCLSTLLNLCCTFWRASGLHTRQCVEQGDGEGDDDDDADADAEVVLKDSDGTDLRVPSRSQVFRAERLTAYRLGVHLEALRLLSDELGVDLAGDIQTFPEWRTVADTERVCRLLAFSHDEAVAWLRSQGQPGEVDTPATVAAQLRGYIDQRAQRWQ